jgi:kumamolisin
MKTGKLLWMTSAVAAVLGWPFAGVSAQVLLGGRTIEPDTGFEVRSDVGHNAHTNFRLFSPREPYGTPDASPGRRTESTTTGLPPYTDYAYETPASLGCVYGLATPVTGCNPNSVTAPPNTGKGAKAIAIVDAYHYPSALADLTKFSAQFGLPAPTSSSFQVIYASGRQPPVNSSWNVEEALDIEWAHTMAPKAVIYLVEANSASFSDLMTAVAKANSILAGTGIVSMSWGGTEFSGETNYDADFSGANVVYFAAAGDNPGVIWPSTSSRVVSVGGTSTSRGSGGNYLSQTTWQSAGGGPSLYESPAPGQSQAITVYANRATPDVAADANPSTSQNFVIAAENWERRLGSRSRFARGLPSVPF